MLALHFSGGGLKGIGQLGAVQGLEKAGYNKYALLSGISIGSVILVPVAMGLSAEAAERLMEADIHTFQSPAAFKKNGKPTFFSKMRYLFNRNSLGKQTDRLKKTVSSFVTPGMFRDFCRSGAMGVVGAIPNRRRSKGRFIEYFDLAGLSYSDYLQIVCASSAMPGFTEPVPFRDELYTDGGLVDHIGTVPALEMAREKGIVPKASVPVYTRPALDSWDMDEPGYRAKSLTDVLIRSFAIAGYEVSSNDERLGDQYCRANGIHQVKVHLPPILKNAYDGDPGRKARLFRAGLGAGEKAAGALRAQVGVF